MKHSRREILLSIGILGSTFVAISVFESLREINKYKSKMRRIAKILRQQSNAVHLSSVTPNINYQVKIDNKVFFNDTPSEETSYQIIGNFLFDIQERVAIESLEQ